MTATVRFAPSPTGRINIGAARTALFNWLFVLGGKGRFIQRFDDTDIARSRPGYADAILYDLHWLGIFPDATEYQSRRSETHDAAVAALNAAGLLYPCYETPEELDLRRKVRRTRGLPPVYGREALALTRDQIAEYKSDARRPHWRFLLPNFSGDPLEPEPTEIQWNDLVRGEETADLALLSDPVLVREDGSYLTLPSVADDIDMGVTHVIRSDEHVAGAGVQIALFRALGAVPPAFAHHGPLTAASGEEVSRRTGSPTIESLREDGLEPMAVASLAVHGGASKTVAETMPELAQRFDLGSASKAAEFDLEQLLVLNRALLRRMPFSEARDRLLVLGISGEMAEPFWLAVRGNVDRLADAVAWWRIVRDGPEEKAELPEEDLDFVRHAFDLVPDDPWDQSVWKDWTGKVKQASGRKGKTLFMPLRLALTGLPSGPELADLLPLVGREGTLARRP